MAKNSIYFLAVALATSLGAGAPAIAAGQSNPVDRVSNRAALDYTDAEIGPRKLDEPFVRDGVVAEPQLLAAISPGVEQARVQALLGTPARQNAREWEYNFKFRMQESQNYLVCQYKVVFDGQQLVSDTVWRRRQCQKLVGADLKGE